MLNNQLLNFLSISAKIGDKKASHFNDHVYLWPGGSTPLYGLIGKCGPKGYGFSAVLVINVDFCTLLSLQLFFFLEKPTSS